MAGSMETELKLRLVDADAWRDLIKWTGWNEIADISSWKQETLEAWYFDTPDYDLRQALLAYRIRREDGKWIAAVKGGGTSEGGLHRRSEWEACIEEPNPDVSCFLNTPVGEQLAGALGSKPLLPIFVTRFERHTLLVQSDEETCIEVAVDRGAIIAGDKQEPIQEIELELKAGSVSALLTLGAELAADFSLVFEERSKYYRGLLAAGLAEKAGKQRKTPIDGAQSAFAGAKELVLRGIYAVMREQTRFIKAIDEPERLHRFRIKFRMLRALLSFIRPLTHQEECRAFQVVLREYGQMLGVVRELDVLAEGWAEMENSEAVALSGHQWLKEVLAAERSSEMARIPETLTKAKLTADLLKLWAWLETEAWQEQAECTFLEFCTARLKEWHEKLLEYGKKPDLSNAENLHSLRIGGKKLRYALEMLDGIPGIPTNELVPRLKLLQHDLGHLRDSGQTASVLHKLLAERSSRAVHREAGLLIGWQARGAFDTKQHAHKVWRRVRRRLVKQLKEMNG